jgi:Terminase large subunit, T4likevirus-type, N-terminal
MGVALDISLHPRQTIAYETRGTEVLYGGAAGGGKSHLIRAAAILWCALIPGLQVYLFRREFPDLYKNHMEGPTGFPALLAAWADAGLCKINYSKNQIQFWNGSKIHLCHCKHEKDIFGYQGAEMHVLIIDEVTHFTDAMYRYLRGRVRLGGLILPKQYLGLFPRILACANPGGIGHNWVKATWVSPRKPFELEATLREEGGLLRQFIPAKLSDNPTLLETDPDYIHRLEGLGNPALVKAMRDGNWDIVAGGALDDVWSDNIVIPRFRIPVGWRVDRSHDWGSARPFSTLWWAEADGTEAVLADGRHWAPPKGTLIAINEWYGARAPNEGLKMPARKVARGIKDIDQSLLSAKWIARTVRPGPADNAIADTQNPGTPTIADDMAKEGVRWERSDKSPGSRRIGLELLRTRLAETAKDVPEGPAFYIMDHCRKLIEHLPVLQRDPKNPEDVDTDNEDHDYDATRYRVLKGSGAAEHLPVTMPH